MAESGSQFPEGSFSREGPGFQNRQVCLGHDGMKAMWDSMQTRARARRALSQPCAQKILNSNMLFSMGSFSHWSGSTAPSASGVSSPRSDCWTSDCDSVVSEKIEWGTPWVYSVPRGCRVKNGFIEFDEQDDLVLGARDPASAWRPLSSATADEPAQFGMQRASGAVCSTSVLPEVFAVVSDAPEEPEEPLAEAPMEVGVPMAAPHGSRGDGCPAKSRPRPSKPKRLQGKALAERLFRAQWQGGKEEVVQARVAFQEETREDPLMQSYTLSVFRCLNSEASSRVAKGEDPMLTAAHS